VFHARGLSKTYHMDEVDVHALRDVDLDIFEGEFVVLLGPSIALIGLFATGPLI
jgi:putative ABC transport system ATP-binding protein